MTCVDLHGVSFVYHRCCLWADHSPAPSSSRPYSPAPVPRQTQISVAGPAKVNRWRSCCSKSLIFIIWVDGTACCVIDHNLPVTSFFLQKTPWFWDLLFCRFLLNYLLQTWKTFPKYYPSTHFSFTVQIVACTDCFWGVGDIKLDFASFDK